MRWLVHLPRGEGRDKTKPMGIWREGEGRVLRVARPSLRGAGRGRAISPYGPCRGRSRDRLRPPWERLTSLAEEGNAPHPNPLPEGEGTGFPPSPSGRGPG